MAMLVQIITPILVVIASYAFGIATKKYEQRTKIYRERYDNLYIPFINWIVHSPLDWNSPGLYKPEIRGKLLNLLLDNSQYMGEKSGSTLKSLYNAHLELYEIDVNHNMNISNVTAPSDYNNLFNEMSFYLLEESSQLASKLQLPDLAKNVVGLSDSEMTHV
ncbi:hypothetical protein ACPBEI_08165 [Latilactobacillus sakei]